MKNIIKWIITICGCLVFTLCISANVYAAEYSIATNNSWVSGSTTGKESNFYIFKIPSAGKVTVTHQSYKGGGQCYLLDRDLVKEYGGVGSSYDDDTSDTNPNTKQFSVNLEAGTYQLKLYGYTWLNLTSTKYRVKISYTPANNNEIEPNNTFDTAMKLTSGKQVKAFFSEDDLLDFYKFTINTQTTIKIAINTSSENALSRYELSVWNSELIEEQEDDSTSSGQTYVWEKSMSPGTYYIKMNGNIYGNYTGIYTLKWEGFNYVTSINLRKTSMTLEKGKTYSLLKIVLPSTATNKKLNWISDNNSVATVNSSGKITAKNVGAATITSTAQDGSKVSASCQVVVKPAKTVIKSCKRAADRNIIVKVKKQKNISGIQYQLSKKKNFKGKTSSYYARATETAAATAILSKNKTYYFRARMYIDYGGKRYYGKWSTVKKIKTKAKTYNYGDYIWKNV